jgi:CheY-like chemotaxis protein
LVREFKKSYRITPAQYRLKLATLGHHKTLEGLLILLVDDDQVMRERISTMLEQVGACVTTMDSCSKALAALQRMRPHILIVDIGLPNGDGYALVQKAQEIFHEQGEQIPAVALALNHSSLDNEKAIFPGFHLHLTESPGSSQLIDAIAKLTGRAAV